MGILPAHRMPLTYKHYLLFPEDRDRHEIIEGEHYMSPSPGDIHQTIVGNLFALFWNHLKMTGQGKIQISPRDVLLSETNVVIPDLLYISKKNLSRNLPKYVRGAPDLAIEVLSPSTSARDLGLKKDLYARFGVKEYWIVDPSHRTVHVFRLGKAGFGRPKRYGRTDTLRSPLIPGLVLALKDVF